MASIIDELVGLGYHVRLEDGYVTVYNQDGSLLIKIPREVLALVNEHGLPHDD